MLNRVAVIVGFAGCVLGWSGRSVAQTSASDRAAAQALFDEGKRLMADNNHQAACTKFQESQNLDPAVGTLFHLAECFEQTGRTASAWAAFVQVADTTRVAGQMDRSRAAGERAKRLEPKLCRLTIVVPEDAEAIGLVITRDGHPIGKGQWGTAVPVDPGTHRIVAEAPGMERWQGDATAIKEGSTTTLSVPKLRAQEANEPISAPMGTAPPGSSAPVTQDAYWEGYEGDSGTNPSVRTYALITAGVGVVGLGLGTYYGLRAKGKRDDSNAFCREPRVCSAEGVALRDEAISSANTSTVAFAVGGVALAGGLVIWLLTGESESPAKATETGIQPTVVATNDGAGLLLHGAW